jgi:hypothetical protein
MSGRRSRLAVTVMGGTTMSEIAIDVRPRPWGRAWSTAAPDFRRVLQLGLAAIWLLDGALQFQPSMYTHSFSQVLAATAAGNPGLIARPITWNASLVAHHDVLLNTVFATIQVLLGVGIACRPSVRAALAASIAWSAGVWWLGEGLGGVLAGTASPVTGAPGAVILYALLAVLLWPADRAVPVTTAPVTIAPSTTVPSTTVPSTTVPSTTVPSTTVPSTTVPSTIMPASSGPVSPAPFTAARAVGPRVARALWLVLWLSLAYFALTPANRAPQALSGAVAAMASGEPGWLAHCEQAVAAALSSHGLGTSLTLAEVFTLIAIGGCLRRAIALPVLGLAIVTALAIWVFGEAFGGILTGAGTDPNTGPLLVLLALAYWPVTIPTAAWEPASATGTGA